MKISIKCQTWVKGHYLFRNVDEVYMTDADDIAPARRYEERVEIDALAENLAESRKPDRNEHPRTVKIVY